MSWAQNPDNPRQYYLLWECGGPTAAENTHPQRAISILASALDFTVLESIPQSVADCWQFWVEFSEERLNCRQIFIPFGNMFRPVTKWLPIGTF